MMPAHAERRSHGQSVVEFALVVPLLLLITLAAIDFGRIYLGWINLQQMARIAAADAADHASAWTLPETAEKAAERASYQQRIARDAAEINCQLPPAIPDPVFSGGAALGAHVSVSISCEFSVITPIVSNVVGSPVMVSASNVFPVREGAVAAVPGGGAPPIPAPVAKFSAGPARSGWAPLTVTLTDASTGGPTSWIWDYSTSTGGTGTGSVSAEPALTQGPHTLIYDCTGTPLDTCTFGVSLRVANAGGSDQHVENAFITVIVPPPSGPVAEFTGTPRAGVEPVTTSFNFVDVRAGTVAYTNWEWDFTSDGTYDATGQTVTHTYPTAGSYDVTLRVTDSTGAKSTLTKSGFVVVQHKICTVPDFFNVKTNRAQQVWTAAGFSTVVTFRSGPNNYSIKYQSIVGGTVDPQPSGCGSVITVGP